MESLEVQNQLEVLYADWKATLRLSKEEADYIGPPLLLRVTDDYCRAERRALLYGQETYGWGWDSQLQATYPAYPHAWRFRDICSCSDFLANQDAIEALCWAYREFQFGAYQPALSRTPFWQAFKEICKWPGTSVMWCNVVRADLSPGGNSTWNALPSLRDTFISQHVTLVAAELAILKPHICLFFSGPDYDVFIKTMLPDCEIIDACAETPKRELARLIHPALPAASFRTYHPRFLSQGNRWGYIEAMRALAMA